MVSVKFRQVFISFFEHYDEVGPDYNMAAQFYRFFYQPSEVRIHFGRSARYVNGVKPLAHICPEAGFHNFMAHYFCPVRSCFHMAMLTRQVAKPANVDLQHIHICSHRY